MSDDGSALTSSSSTRKEGDELLIIRLDLPIRNEKKK
jgi:hypothetical protein